MANEEKGFQKGSINCEEKGFQKGSINCLIPIYLTPPRNPYK